jgi:hypothetical protein
MLVMAAVNEAALGFGCDPTTIDHGVLGARLIVL